MGKIRFTINYKVSQKRKFEKFLDSFSNEIHRDFINLRIEKYWKIPEQFQAQFLIETEYSEKEKRVYEMLILANKLWSKGSSNWTINGPHEYGNLTFECILNNENDDQPLKWAHIELEYE